MNDGIEDLDDLAVGFDRAGDGDDAVEQVPDRLRDDRLSVSRRAVDEQRVRAVDGRSELIQHAFAQHQVRERLADAPAGRRLRHRSREPLHVRLVLDERHRRHADVMALFEEQQGTVATGRR